MRVLLIGAGNLGGAFARAFVRNKVLSVRDLAVVEVNKKKRQALARDIKCKVFDSLPEDVPDYDLLFLAIKPQDFPVLALNLKGILRSKQLVLSVMAGFTSKALSKLLDGHKKIICCMPNLPVTVGQGFTVICASDVGSKSELKFVHRLFRSVGETITVQDPNLLDAATSLSASGCGFNFYLIEHMLEAARMLGYKSGVAEKLVYRTILGALTLWRETGIEPGVWRERVTSKGGTTQAGLEIFNKAGVGDAIIEGYLRAFKRCAELRRR